MHRAVINNLSSTGHFWVQPFLPCCLLPAAAAAACCPLPGSQLYMLLRVETCPALKSFCMLKFVLYSVTPSRMVTLFRWRTGEKGHSFFWDHGLHVAPWTQLHTCVGSNPDKRAPLMGLVLELSHSDAVRERWPDSSLYRSVNVNELQGCPLCLAALSWIFQLWQRVSSDC